MTNHPLKQLAIAVDENTNCGKDLAQLIVSFDVDFKQLKLDLLKAMKDRIDRKLEYKKISYHEGVADGDIFDYEISTIIHGGTYMIFFTTSICHRSGLVSDEPYDKSQSLITEITYNEGEFSCDQISDDNYPRKSLHKLTKEEFDNFHI